jgi:6-phosphogluconate dehydrogenase
MTPPDSDTHFGLTGLAVMGANLARNVAHHDIPVVVHNRTTSRMTTFLEQHGSEGQISGRDSIEKWVGALARPRVLMSMVQAGAATDAVIDDIAPHLDAGDVLIDGGNANFRDTQRRHAALAQQDIHFLGVGVSGGEEGALNGPSIMPGGDRGPYDDLRGDRRRCRRDPVRHLCRRRWRGALRQDGPQRHRVRRHAAHRREL